MNYEEFTKFLMAIGELFDKKLSPAVFEIYYEVLKEYPWEDILHAFNQAIRTCKFFPKPAEIIEIIEGSPQSRAEVAWRDVLDAISSVGGYESITFDDPAINIVIEQLGGWIELTGKTKEELKFLERNFKQLYNFYISRQVESISSHLPGIIECENRARGFSKHIPKAVQRKTSLKLSERSKVIKFKDPFKISGALQNKNEVRNK